MAGQEKINAAKGALELIKPGMVVGLGTGTTAAEFIKLLAEKAESGLDVTCVATSLGSHNLAVNSGLQVVDLQSVDTIDIAVDGADIATKSALLKGGGGALTREKIVDYEAKKFVVIVDESKLKRKLGGTVVVEVLPFSHTLVLRKLRAYVDNPVLRLRQNEPVITDNGNYIIDCNMQVPAPKKLEQALNSIPGVIENGIFTKFERIIKKKEKGHRVWV